MIKLELNEDIENAAVFLQDQVQLSYFGVLSCLSQVQDFYLKEQALNARKEVLFINETFKTMSHTDDMKVTYTNGFHVNLSLTRTRMLNIDENPLTQDFSEYERCIQPVIDENALAPSQFTLISNMFDQNSMNLRTFKKNKTYMGCQYERDYGYLDYSLLNLDKGVRRYLQTNFMSVDSQLKEYVKLKSNHEDAFFVGNTHQYFDMLHDKKMYLKTMLRSRQLKRIVMILLTNKQVPLDLKEHQNLLRIF